MDMLFLCLGGVGALGFGVGLCISLLDVDLKDMIKGVGIAFLVSIVVLGTGLFLQN